MKREKAINYILLITLVSLVSMAIALDLQVPKSRSKPTPTPWVKQSVLVKLGGAGLQVWSDDAARNEPRIATIEGVEGVWATTKNRNEVLVDLRYSKELVAQEIVNLLSQPMPAVPAIGESYW